MTGFLAHALVVAGTAGTAGLLIAGVIWTVTRPGTDGLVRLRSRREKGRTA